MRTLELCRQFCGERRELLAKDLFYSYEFLGETEAERAGISMRTTQMRYATNQNSLNLSCMFEAYIATLIKPIRVAARAEAEMENDVTDDKNYGGADVISFHFRNLRSEIFR